MGDDVAHGLQRALVDGGARRQLGTHQRRIRQRVRLQLQPDLDHVERRYHEPRDETCAGPRDNYLGAGAL